MFPTFCLRVSTTITQVPEVNFFFGTPFIVEFRFRLSSSYSSDLHDMVFCRSETS